MKGGREAHIDGVSVEGSLSQFTLHSYAPYLCTRNSSEPSGATSDMYRTIIASESNSQNLGNTNSKTLF